MLIGINAQELTNKRKKHIQYKFQTFLLTKCKVCYNKTRVFFLSFSFRSGDLTITGSLAGNCLFYLSQDRNQGTFPTDVTSRAN